MLASTYYLAALPLVVAHSWVERLRRLDLNGMMVGDPGYIRGARSRLDPGFTDSQLMYMLPPNGRAAAQGILPTDYICKDTQRVLAGIVNQSFPLLQARPGELIALQYQENGHVMLPDNSPQKAGSGAVSIYGTMSPSQDDRFLLIHGVWNTTGTGGDGRGVLLARRPFDNGRCHQINNGSISMVRQELYYKTFIDPQGAVLWCLGGGVLTRCRPPFFIRSLICKPKSPGKNII